MAFTLDVTHGMTAPFEQGRNYLGALGRCVCSGDGYGVGMRIEQDTGATCTSASVPLLSTLSALLRLPATPSLLWQMPLPRPSTPASSWPYAVVCTQASALVVLAVQPLTLHSFPARWASAPPMWPPDVSPGSSHSVCPNLRPSSLCLPPFLSLCPSSIPFQLITSLQSLCFFPAEPSLDIK